MPGRGRRSLGAFAWALLAVLTATTAAGGTPLPVPTAAAGAVPVRVGSHPDVDACPSLGRVAVRRGGFLAVRTGPNVRYPMRDRLGPGRELWLCEDKGGWYGVVYARRQGSDCGVGTAVATRRPYAGPCRQGWVRAAYVEVVAG